MTEGKICGIPALSMLRRLPLVLSPFFRHRKRLFQKRIKGSPQADFKPGLLPFLLQILSHSFQLSVMLIILLFR